MAEGRNYTLAILGGFGLFGLLLAGGLVAAVYVYVTNLPSPGPAPDPRPIADHFVGLAEALEGDDPLRLKKLRDLWDGLALTLPTSGLASIVQIQRTNQLAGQIASISASNEVAAGIVVAGWQKIELRITDPLDAAELAIVAGGFRAMADHADNALQGKL